MVVVVDMVDGDFVTLVVVHVVLVRVVLVHVVDFLWVWPLVIHAGAALDVAVDLELGYTILHCLN